MVNISVSFEERAVAFIDILGFSKLVEDVASGSVQARVLDELVTLLDQAIPLLNSGVSLVVPDVLIPQHMQISDSIILSAPLKSKTIGWHNYSGLEIVVMRAIQLTQMFLKAGYLIRGGISVGKAWHAPFNIIGPAYQEAYELEKNTSAPRIVLSAAAIELWNESRSKGSRLCLVYDDLLMVNGLHDYYFGTNDMVSTEQVFNGFSKTIKTCIADAPSDKIKTKWEWFDRFLRSQQH
jgi:hypothetical protein